MIRSGWSISSFADQSSWLRSQPSSSKTLESPPSRVKILAGGDFSFLNNLGTFTTKVIYTGDKTNLFADKIEMNLTTKDTKIFMNDNRKKVLIEGTK